MVDHQHAGTSSSSCFHGNNTTNQSPPLPRFCFNVVRTCCIVNAGTQLTVHHCLERYRLRLRFLTQLLSRLMFCSCMEKWILIFPSRTYDVIKNTIGPPSHYDHPWKRATFFSKVTMLPRIISHCFFAGKYLVLSKIDCNTRLP